MEEVRIRGLEGENRARFLEKLAEWEHYGRNGYRGHEEVDGEMRIAGFDIESDVRKALSTVRCEIEAGPMPVRRVSVSRSIDLKDVLVLRPEWRRKDASRWLASQQEDFEKHMKRCANLFLAQQLPQSPDGLDRIDPHQSSEPGSCDRSVRALVSNAIG